MDIFDRLCTAADEEYGMCIDREEGWFTCPECGEPVYLCDWKDEDFNTEEGFGCPICGFTMIEEE